MPRIEISIGRAELPGTDLVLQDVHLSCATPRSSGGFMDCDAGEASAKVAGWGALHGVMRLRYVSAQQWTANLSRVAVAAGELSLVLEQKASGLELAATASRVPVERLLSLARLLKVPSPLAGTGVASGTISGTFSATGWIVAYDLKGAALTLHEAGGRYATEKLGLELRGTATCVGQVVSAVATLRLSGGQAYVEPIFADFGVHPMQARLDLRWRPAVRQLDVASVAWDQPDVTRGSAVLTATLGDTVALARADVTVASAVLPAFAQTYLQPFLAGTRAEGLSGSGVLSGSLRVEGGQVRRAEVFLDGVGVQAPQLDSELQDIRGAIHWASAEAAPSALRWSGGRVRRVPIGAAEMEFLAQGRDFALLKPWRQPILDGALNAQRLKLAHLGLADVSADVQAQVEPIDLAQLCEALGWPKFSGQLSGQLPGLTMRDQELTLDGKLEARAFDSNVTIESLRWIEPLGVLPRLAASVRLRNLDLGELTSAFSFGRIEGRLDGDVDNLRVLGWEPVAFTARLQTPPGDRSRHRISQRAIDNISSIGGGPRGVLSRGFLRVFKDFNYDRLGWSCTLANGVCNMDGVEPSKDGKGYVLVKGRSLPRIDVVGYSHEVGWDQLVMQVKTARTSPPTTTPPK